ncbi:hypothetical protein AVEN_55928-1 [Araneus ventricosus]|uniref:Uncharacterized protein n=1 Tax=Araneus ventricosus TaxID=182803 RepID=A0A4Y2N043_ARAVE|nr:hypothetical protein AVEN_229216-1 [Araneus ventricosus]GBN32695.1 hypothetical protein AVEN_55928-1 [Araneus ventricosus]
MQKEEWMSIDEDIPVAATLTDSEMCQAVCEQDQAIKADDSDDAEYRGLEVNSNDIDKLVEEHGQELTTEELMELHCVSRQEIVEEEEVIAKQQSSSVRREMLKAWETVAPYIEKHNPNKAVVKRSTNLFYDNAVSDFRQSS